MPRPNKVATEQRAAPPALELYPDHPAISVAGYCVRLPILVQTLACLGCTGTRIVDAPRSPPGLPQTAVCSIPTTINDFPIAGAIGNKWNAATHTLAYERPRADGHYATYLSDVDGRHSRRLTYAGWRDARHQ